MLTMAPTPATTMNTAATITPIPAPAAAPVAAAPTATGEYLAAVAAFTAADEAA